MCVDYRLGDTRSERLALRQAGLEFVLDTVFHPRAAQTLAYSYPDEFHFYPPNTDLLRAISNQTKGRFQPSVQDILDAHGETTAFPTPLRPWLAVAALVLYVGDVLLRRVRLFE